MPEVSREYLLLCEGRDECSFFEALLHHMTLAAVQPIEVGGQNKFPDELPTLLNDPGFTQVKAYAIVRDADVDAQGTLQSVRDLLEKLGEACPSGHSEFASDGKRKVGIFIMPGSSTQVMLETLCLQTVANHPVMRCVDRYIECLQQRLERREPGQQREQGIVYYPSNETKTRAHDFLAGMPDMVPSVGLAAKRGYSNLNHTAMDELRTFLTALISAG